MVGKTHTNVFPHGLKRHIVDLARSSATTIEGKEKAGLDFDGILRLVVPQNVLMMVVLGVLQLVGHDLVFRCILATFIIRHEECVARPSIQIKALRGPGKPHCPHRYNKVATGDSY
jgi:hypothetical protein